MGVAKAIGETSPEGMLVRINLENRVEVDALSRKEGNVTVIIPPDDILVSRAEVYSSARNSLKGKIVKIEEEDSSVYLSVDIGVILTVQITEKSREHLKLNLNDDVFVTFKASSLRVL